MADYIRVQGVMEKGFGLMPKMVALDTNLHIEAKAIYAYFCSYAGAGQNVFPSIATILKHLRISKDRYYKYRKELEENGYINIIQRRDNKGKSMSNIYELCTIVKIPNTENRCPENQDTENRDTENRDTENRYPENKETNNNKYNNNKYNNNNNNNNKYKKVLSNEFNKKEIESISRYCITNNIDVDVVKDKLNLVKNMRNVRNKAAALITAIKDDWDMTVTKSNTNGFNNFKARDYDYDDLENKLLGWDK